MFVVNSKARSIAEILAVYIEALFESRFDSFTLLRIAAHPTSITFSNSEEWCIGHKNNFLVGLLTSPTALLTLPWEHRCYHRRAYSCFQYTLFLAMLDVISLMNFYQWKLELQRWRILRAKLINNDLI